MGEIRKLLDEQQRLRREMYRNHNGKAAFKDYKSYVQREIRRFEFNYWNQICDDIMAKANAGDSRGYYAALKNMYGDQPNKADSHKAFKKADGQLTQSPEETLAVMELHTRNLLNQPGSANLSTLIDIYLHKLRFYMT